MLLVSLSSSLCVTDGEGRDVTPKSAKSRGLLAILAMSRDLRRSRMWLRGKLWSMSGTTQGSDSLRQALTEIRRALRENADALIADRRSVSLDPDKVEILKPAAGAPEYAELCSDLEIADPAFQDWLRGTRQHGKGDLSATPSISDVNRGAAGTVVFSLAHDVPCDVQWVYQSLRESISALLRESGNIDVVTEREPVPVIAGQNTRLFFIVVDVNLIASHAVVSLRLECNTTGKTVWSSGQKWLLNDNADETLWELHKLSFSAHEQAANTIANTYGEAGGGNNTYALANRGRNRLFDFSREGLMEADRCFDTAYKIEPRGLYLAWRHFVRSTATFEHLTDDFLEPINRVDLIEQAVVDSSANSFVLAVASQDAYVRKDDINLANALVKDAMDANQVNPLGLGFQSNLLVLTGDFDKSIEAAKRAQLLVSNQPYRGFWSMFLCMSYVAKGDYETAVFHANMAHYLMPRLVPAQRFLYALNEALGRESQALSIYQKIRQREPNFSKRDLFRSDYPVGTMRRTGIMDLLS